MVVLPLRGGGVRPREEAPPPCAEFERRRLDLLDSIPIEMVGCVLSVVLLQKEKKAEHCRDEDRSLSPPHQRLR